MKKTNAMRFLDRAKIEYEIKNYEVDESDLSATTVAKKVNLDEIAVFKTLLVRANTNEYFFLCISSNFELDTKKSAKALKVKKIDFVAVKDLLKITGYIRGGVSPICMKKQFKVVFDSNIEKLEQISISAGVRGTQILLQPKDIIRVLNAEVNDLILKN